MQENITEKASLKGIYKFTKAKLELPEHFELEKDIRRNIEKGKDASGLIKMLNEMCQTQEFVYQNIVPTVGRTMIADNLTNSSPDNTMRVTHAALGSDGTTPANGDTTLGTEVYRNAIASETNGDNVAYITGFFNSTETTGTYSEAGIFSDATGTTDSGILVSHVLISITKSNTETLTLDWTLTIA